jgi:hypothetical protein
MHGRFAPMIEIQGELVGNAGEGRKQLSLRRVWQRQGLQRPSQLIERGF